MTKPGTPCNQREIVFMPFPFTDLSGIKKRPALILSNRQYNSQNEDAIFCAITKSLQPHHGIKITDSDMESGRLVFESKIKPDKLFLLKQNKIIKTLAKLNIEKSEEVVKELNILIKIDK